MRWSATCSGRLDRSLRRRRLVLSRIGSELEGIFFGGFSGCPELSEFWVHTVKLRPHKWKISLQETAEQVAVQGRGPRAKWVVLHLMKFSTNLFNAIKIF